MAARVVQRVRGETGMSVYSGCTDTLVSSYCRIVCVSAVQQLSNLIIEATGFSLALDSATLHGMYFLDVRVRFVREGRMQNFHLLGVPQHEAHTGKRMCNILAKLLDAVCPLWRLSLVGVSKDGEAKLTGRNRGLATLVEEETTARSLIRIWCGLQQLDLVLQKVYKIALNDDFLRQLTAVIGTCGVSSV
jgi:hypothetical protein